MFEAKIKGSNNIVSYFEFIHKFKGKYQNKEIELQCPACLESVYLYGDKSLEVTGRFQHFPGTTCIFYGDFIEGITGPGSFNLENGQRLRSLVETKEFASKLYCFCLRMCGGRHNLTVEKFCELIKLADRKKLWMAANIEEWVIGFLLLLLKDFEGHYLNEQKRKEGNPTYTFGFVLVKEGDEKVRSICLDEIWEKKSFYLKRVFDSGKLMNVANNPFPVTPELYEEFLDKYDQTLQNLGDSLVRKIKEMRNKNAK